MLDFLRDEPQNVVVVGDAFVASETLEEAVKASQLRVNKLSRAFWGTSDPEEFAAQRLHLERGGPEPSPGPAAWRS